MIRSLATIASATMLASCGLLEGGIQAEYIAADRATYDVIAPAVLRDPELSDDPTIVLVIESWALRLESAEMDHDR